MEDGRFSVGPAACCLPAPPRVLIDEDRDDECLGMEFSGAVRFDSMSPMGSFASVPMGRTMTWGEVIGEMPPGVMVKEEKVDRKETMKMYMRNYRRRQKSSLDALPAHERDLIQRKQRERVRERVRRHRLRKKLKATGLGQDEVEKRLQELVPSLNNARSAFAFGQNPTRHQMAICLDVPITKAAPAGSQTAVNPTNSLRDQLPEMLGSQAPFVMPQNYIPGQSTKFNFDQRSDISYSGENDDGQGSDMKLSPSSWSTNQVVIFLEGLQLSHLKPAFEGNTIDGVSLLSLTTARLRDMGVGPEEIREELLTAIDSLKKVSMFS